MRGKTSSKYRAASLAAADLTISTYLKKKTKQKKTVDTYDQEPLTQQKKIFSKLNSSL